MKQFTEIFVIVLIGAVIVWYASMRKAEEVHVQCVTTKGNLEIAVVPSWSPRAAERFLKMVDDGFFTRLPLFRCIENFVCQFGASFPSANRKTYDFFLDDPAQPALRYFKKGY
jgi:cyclophilin family peptidyl-prolyl cis-trans isomerase